MKLEAIYISPESNYWSHKKGEPGSAPTENLNQVECVAGSGLVGDRFFDFKDNYNGQVTLISKDQLDQLKSELGTEFSHQVFRRNLLISGIHPHELIGKTFKIGNITMEGQCDCAPCFWMDTAAGEGAFKWMKDQNAGGLRAKILDSGTLTVGDTLTLS